MKPLIAPVPAEVLQSELTPDKFVRVANKGGHHIYIVTWKNAPNVLREIGRLRELTFRDAGGGTGKDCDLDVFDISDMPYKQLIVWNDEDKEITGGYRFIKCGDAFDEMGRPFLATAELLAFSEKFKKEYLPYTIELG